MQNTDLPVEIDALVTEMPRPEAQAAIKALCAEATESATPLADLVTRDFPALDVAALFDPARQMGEAPTLARDFVQRVKNLQP